MLDKIFKFNKNQAYLIYQDGRIVSLYSSSNVDDIILTMILPTFYDGTMPSYCKSLEDTSSIDLKKVSNG